MKRKHILLASIATVLIAVYLLISLIPSSEKSWQQSVCRLSAKSCYALRVGSGDTLYISLHPQNAPVASLCADSLNDSVETSGVFVSQAGHIITSDSLILSVPDTLKGEGLKKKLFRLDSLIGRQRTVRHEKLKELDYYANTHSATDDGYNEVMAYREEIKKQATEADTLLLLLQKALKDKAPVAVRHTAYSLHRFFKNEKGVLLQQACRLEERGRESGLLLLQTQDALLPQWAERFSVHRFGAYAAGRRLVAFNDFGGPTAGDSSEVVAHGASLFPTSEGGAWVNASGQLCGIQRRGERVSSHLLARLLRREHIWPVWWWENFADKVKRLFASSKKDGAEGEKALQHSLGKCIRAIQADSSLYEGQAAIPAKRGEKVRKEGYGRLTLPDGTAYEGFWQADTLASGQRTDSAGTYRGSFNASLQAQGSGAYFKFEDEDFYSGQWQANRRHGHGFSCRADKMVRCGEWKNDRFQGERMVYTADRVYGIDISRYQHGKGRRYIPIYWDRLRITSLGSGRRVAGSVDYPVSFVYIKATEGRSLLNKYYAADLRQARRHGIPVGSYHFFSPTSTGAQQAAYFLKMAWVAAGDLPPVLDLEPTEKQIKQMGGDAAMFRQVLVWLQTVEKARGKRPVLYVGQQFVNKHLVNAPAAMRNYDVWIARYGEFKPYVKLLHWQLTPYGRVRGITGEVDINVFNGTKAQFKKYLQSN